MRTITWQEIEVGSVIRTEQRVPGVGPRLDYTIAYEGRVEHVTDSFVILTADGRKVRISEVDGDVLTLVSEPPLTSGYYRVERSGVPYVRYWDGDASAWMTAEGSKGLIAGQRDFYKVINRIVQP